MNRLILLCLFARTKRVNVELKLLPVQADGFYKKTYDVNMASFEIVQPSSAPVEQENRREARFSVVLPLRLTTGSGEMIPAVILNVSASGLLLLVDERASLVLPPPRGARIDGEFFFDDIEVEQMTLEVTRIERRRHKQFLLGCKFINLSPDTIARIRTKVMGRFTKSTSL